MGKLRRVTAQKEPTAMRGNQINPPQDAAKTRFTAMVKHRERCQLTSLLLVAVINTKHHVCLNSKRPLVSPFSWIVRRRDVYVGFLMA